MPITVTDVLAIWGAVVSTFAVTLSATSWWRDRPRLHIRAMLAEMVPSDDDRPHLVLTVVNLGHRPILLQKWGWLDQGVSAGGGIVIAHELPRMLKEGDSVTLKTHELSILGESTKEIVIWDMANRSWRLPAGQIRRARAELANLKARGLIDEAQLQRKRD